MSRTLFTADLHFGHANILRFCSRPFADIDAHDRALVENWNAVVGPRDIVYVVGDFAYKCHPQRLKQLFDALRGHKHLVVGNHDLTPTRSLPWETVSERAVVSVDNVRLVLDHYPGRSWAGSNRGSIQLFGHTHGRLPDLHNACDVGVDRWGYMPTTLPQIVARLAEIPKPTYDEDDVAEDDPSGPKI